VIPAVLTTLAFWLAGHAVLGASRAARRRGSWELHTTALLLGLATAIVAYVALAILAGPVSATGGRLLLAGLALPGALFVHKNVGKSRGASPAHEPWTRAQLALVVATAGFAAFALFDAAGAPMNGFDSIYHYAYKGRVLAHEGYATPVWTDYRGAIGRSMTHPGYPLGLPALDALVGCVRGGFDEDAARPLMGLFAVTTAVLLAVALRPLGRGVALLAALVWISLPVLHYWHMPHDELALGAYGLVFGPESGAARFGGSWARDWGVTLDGTADLPLGAFLFGALLHLSRAFDARRESDTADLVSAGVLLGAAMLMKNEGQALALLMLLVFGLVHRRVRAPLVVGLIAMLCIGVWLFARPDLPVVDEDYGSRLAPGNLLASLGRAPEVAMIFARAFGDVLVWNLLWPLFFGALGWSLARPRDLLRHPVWPALLVVLGALALYFAVLLVAPIYLDRLWDTGVPARLFLHIAPVAIWVTFSLLWRAREA
jgi:hypothetical protein